MGFRTRLFLLSFGVVLLTLISAYVYLSRQTRADIHGRLQNELQIRLDLVDAHLRSVHIPKSDLQNWDRVADEFGEAARARVTLIRLDGVVIGDSEVPSHELASVENHASRPEVRQALVNGTGASSRYSDTVHMEMLYHAQVWKRNNEVIGVVRLSLPLVEADLAVSSLLGRLAIAGLVGLIVAFVASSLTAHVFSRRVHNLTTVAQRMSAGELDQRGDVRGHDEFAQLAETLNGLADNLSRTLLELRTERDRLTRVLRSMHEGVLLLDQDGRIQLFNGAAQEMLLLSGHAMGEPAVNVLGDGELLRLLQRALEGENTSSELQLPAPSARQVLANVRRLHQRSGALAVLVDITERRRLETIRQEFVANASHELRTPLAAILSAAETLEDAASDPDARKSFLGIIHRNAERLRSLVNDLLELSRLESGKMEAECASMRLLPAAESTLTSLLPVARDKNIELVCLIPSDTRVLANAQGVEHVLANLVQNAINYCPAGSRVTVSSKEIDQGIEVSVADNGPGIAQEHQDRVFERFYRVDAGRSRNVGGTGLGLSIVRHWMEAMGGSVRVKSHVGKGSTFFIRFQRVPQAAT